MKWSALRDAVLDTTGATTWWGDCAHGVVLVWAMLLLAGIAGVSPVVVVVASLVFVTAPVALARQRYWARVGRRDPKLPGVALGFLVTAGVGAVLVAIRLDASIWSLGVLLTACQVLTWAIARALIRRSDPTAQPWGRS